MGLISCSNYIEYYSISITNNYFETLHNIKIDNVQYDSLLVSSTSATKLIEKGSHVFSCETESNLILETNLDVKGNVERIKLFINENGQLSK